MECKASCDGDAKPCQSFASRRMWPWQADLPPLLTLQLKRFRRYRARFEKSVTSVAVPPTLSLDDLVLDEAKLESLKPHLAKHVDLDKLVQTRSSANGDARPLEYELYGICVHQGATMGSGHYIAFVNSGPSLEKEDWLGLSDTKVWACSRAEVLKAEAYVAFYRRMGLVAAAAPEAAVAAAAPEDGDPGDGAVEDEN